MPHTADFRQLNCGKKEAFASSFLLQAYGLYELVSI